MIEICCSNGRFFLGKGLVTAIDAVHGVVTHVSAACVTCAKSWSSRPKKALQKFTNFDRKESTLELQTKRSVTCRTQNTLVDRLWHLNVGWHTFWPGATFDDVEEHGGFLIFEVFFVFLDLFCMSFFDVPFLGRGSSYNRYNLDHPYDKEMICLKKRSKPHDGWVVLMKELWVISEFQEISIPSDVQNLPDWQMVFYMDQKYVGILREISTPWE